MYTNIIQSMPIFMYFIYFIYSIFFHLMHKSIQPCLMG